jgi:hypothetical protein
MSAPVTTPPKLEKCPTCGANQTIEKNPERGQILRMYRALLKEQLNAITELQTTLPDAMLKGGGVIDMAVVQAGAATVWTTWEKKRLI